MNLLDQPWVWMLLFFGWFILTITFARKSYQNFTIGSYVWGVVLAIAAVLMIVVFGQMMVEIIRRLLCLFGKTPVCWGE